ncbi:phage neck terminator protein [Anaerosolibacter sp.]|uniref:phage neck terminator protein n=1 Tax=Anaerosolibacter sp. TaxID=1872527 RepID=UPI0039F03F89
MIDFIDIRNHIVLGLHNFTQRPVILMEQAYPKPKKADKKTIDYPFFTYKFTTPYISESHEPSYSTEKVASSDENFEYDLKYTRHEMSQISLSITAYSLDSDQSYQNALEAVKWFEFIGEDYLMSKGIVVIDTGNLQNRDTLIVDDYERRVGFDVRLRVDSIVTKTLETIETTDIKMEE